MLRLGRLIVVLGAVGLPTVGSADVPRATAQPEMVNPDWAKLGRIIRAYRRILEVVELDVRRGRFCGPIEQIRDMKQTLRQMEAAYASGRPFQAKRQ
jgi:hypothetical protein